MSVSSIVPHGPRYWVTPEGHAAAWAEGTCDCEYEPRLGMLICRLCGNAALMLRPAAARPTFREKRA